MKAFKTIEICLVMCIVLTSCASTPKQEIEPQKSLKSQEILNDIRYTYENLEQFQDDFSFGENSSPTSVFFGDNNTFEVFTNAGGCTTGSCPLTRIKSNNDSLHQEMMGFVISKPLEKDPITIIQTMNGYIPLPPQLYLKYKNNDLAELAKGLTYEKLLDASINKIQTLNNLITLEITSKNGQATAFFNQQTSILDSLKMSYIPINVATDVKTELVVVFDHERTKNKKINYDFSNLKKTHRPLQIFSQWLNGTELKRDENLDRVTDFQLTKVGDHDSISFKNLVKDKNTLISIWETGFNPATWNFRDFNKLKNKLDGQFDNLQFVSLIRHEETTSIESIHKFKAAYGLDIPTYLASENYFQKLKVPSYPAFIVINKEGIVVNTYFGYDTNEFSDLENDIKEMYN